MTPGGGAFGPSLEDDDADLSMSPILLVVVVVVAAAAAARGAAAVSTVVIVVVVEVGELSAEGAM